MITMTNEQPTVPQWVCEHCFIHLVNGDCTEPDTCHVGEPAWAVDAEELTNIPLHLFGDMHVTPGMLSEHHECIDVTLVFPGAAVDCERNLFSTKACDGCGSNLRGERHAVTGWIKKGE